MIIRVGSAAFSATVEVDIDGDRHDLTAAAAEALYEMIRRAITADPEVRIDQEWRGQ